MSSFTRDDRRGPTATGRSTIDLDRVRERVVQHFEAIRDHEGPFGSYRRGPKQRTDLYASLDIAITHAVMGIDLRKTLHSEDRREWIEHIHSYLETEHNVVPPRWEFVDRLGHSPAHAHGMAIGAISSLAGSLEVDTHLYQPIATLPHALGWLDREIDWSKLWAASHELWGRLLMFSFTSDRPEGWLEGVVDWLDAELDPGSGLWRKGVAPADRHQPIGGAAHILPLYALHGRRHPYPEALIDSILAAQLDNGRWYAIGEETTNYLELDALYLLDTARQWAPAYRTDDISAAADRYADHALADWHDAEQRILFRHPHRILAAVGILGLLQRHCPDRVKGDTDWTDIFSDPRLCDAGAVESPHQ